VAFGTLAGVPSLGLGPLVGRLPRFTQPISAPNARGGRTDDVQVPGTGTLNLVVITQ
jgi:hypothetical protein